MRWIALLRGINVGGHNKVPMADLRAGLAAAGYADVATYVQSGNVVLTADHDEAAICAGVAAVVRDVAGVDVPVRARTAEELEAVVALDPHGSVADDLSRSVVAFLPAPLDAERVAALEGRDWGEERLAVDGRELHLWLPGGLQRSPLAIAVGRTAPEATVRNRRTVLKLDGLARSR